MAFLVALVISCRIAWNPYGQGGLIWTLPASALLASPRGARLGAYIGSIL